MGDFLPEIKRTESEQRRKSVFKNHKKHVFLHLIRQKQKALCEV